MGKKYFTVENIGKVIFLEVVEGGVRNILIERGVSEDVAALTAKVGLAALSYTWCVENEKSSCNQRYTAWLHAPELAEMACFKHRNAGLDLPQRVAANEQRLFAIKDEMAAIQAAAQRNQLSVSIASCR